MNSTDASYLNTSLYDSTVAATTDGAGVDAYAAYIYDLAEKIFVSVFPIILLVGLTGNTISFILMQRKEMRSSPVSVYMSALAVADSLVLILDFLNNWLKMVPKVYLLNSNVGFCKFHRWFFDVVYTYAAWLVMSLAAERFIVVLFPLRARQICTKKNAIIAVSVYPVIISCVYMYSLWSWYVDADGQCNIRNEYFNLMAFINPWITATLYSYVPTVVLVFCSVGILIQIRKMKQQRQQLSSQTDEKKKNTASEQEIKLAITVLAVCVAFFVLTVPVTIYYVVAFNFQQFVYQGPEMALVETFILIFGLSNNAINFFLYVLTSEKFRNELRKMMPCLPASLKMPGSRKDAYKDSSSSSSTATANDKTRVTTAGSSIVQHSLAPVADGKSEVSEEA